MPGTESSTLVWADLAIIPLIVALSVPSLVQFGHDWVVGKDAIRYLFAGSGLVSGLGLQAPGNVPFNGGHGPGFPALIGSLVLVFGHDVGVLAWAIRLLALLNALLAYFLVKRISRPLAGLIAAALLSLFGSINLTFNIDTVLLAIYLLELLTLLGTIRRNSTALALLSGGLLGISILTKESGIVNAPLALLAVLLLDWELRGALWYYLGALLVCLPWWAWNYSATGEVYLIDRLPSSLQLAFLVVITIVLVIATLAYTTGMITRFLAEERRRRWTGWSLVLAWTVSLTSLALSTGAPALAGASFNSLRFYLAGVLAPTIIVLPMLILPGAYALWKAFRRDGPWTLFALAILFQVPVCLLVVVEEWNPRQYLVLGALLLCAMAALVADAGAVAWRGHGYSARLVGFTATVTLVIVLLAASVVRVQALHPEKPVGGSSERHEVSPQATRMVDWMTEHVPEGHNISITPAFSLNRYFKFLDERRHHLTFLQMDQGKCEPRPNGQVRCNPDENAISSIPPDAIWVRIGNQCNANSLSMTNLLRQLRRTHSSYLMISGGYKFPGIMGLPWRLQKSGAFEIVHSELDKGASGQNESFVLLRGTGRNPEAVPALMLASTVYRLRRCEQAEGPGYEQRIRSGFPNGIRTRTHGS